MLRREQAARLEAERANRLKDEFLATLSHELRTPLNAIMGWAHVLGQSSHDRDTVQRASAVIRQNATSQSQLIDDILDVSRIVGGRLVLDTQLVNLHTVIDDAIDSLMPAASAKSIQVERAARSGHQGHRRSRSPAAGGVEPGLERVQVHAEGRQGRGQPGGSRRRCADRGGRHRHRHLARNSCRSCSIGSARPTAP